MSEFNTHPITQFPLNVPVMEEIPEIDAKLRVGAVMPVDTPPAVYQLSRNAFDWSSNVAKDYAAEVVRQFSVHSNTTSGEISTYLNALGKRLSAVEQQAVNLLIKNQLLKNKLDDAVDAGGVQTSSATQGIKTTKMSDVSYFTGNKSSNNKFQHWLNLLALFFEATGLSTDRQKIVYTLTRVQDHAASFLDDYHRLIADEEDLGTWKEFVERMTSQFGQRDPKITAQQELFKIWVNKVSETADFMTFAEKYRTIS
jgi:hypothetical protein